MRKVDIETFEYKGYMGVIAYNRIEYKQEVLDLYPDIITFANNWYCGYVVIPVGHPLYEVHYDDTYNSNMDVEVHGGLTYSDTTILKTGEWLLGFDCNHFMDSPEVQNAEYTKNEIIKMIDQLISFEGKKFEVNVE